MEGSQVGAGSTGAGQPGTTAASGAGAGTPTVLATGGDIGAQAASAAGQGSAAARPVVLTCAQPSGQALTIGNYLGAIQHWVSFLDRAECYFGLVDLHAMTVPYEPAALRANTWSVLAQYVAAGLDPERCALFVQSHVTGHTELAWLLGCVTSIGELERMTQFKDKRGKLREGDFVGSGLLFYPVLMAADILLYNADVVPVGEDQRQHLELCRDLGDRFNRRFGGTFTIPAASIPPVGAKIRSLQDPTRKMSKSDPDAGATLFLTDPPNVLRKKIMSAVTDSGAEVRFAEDKPGVSNLLTILSAVTGRPVPELEAEFAGQGYGKFKAAVADAVVAKLEPISRRHAELLKDRAYLEGVLKRGAEAAQKRAYRVLAKAYKRAGLVERPR